MEQEKSKRYIWEYALSGEKQKVRFEQPGEWKPYQEITEERQEGECVVCRYNALYRYETVFRPYFEKEGLPGTREEQAFFDAVSHTLAEADGREGFSFGEYRRRMFGKELEQGRYGEKVQRLYTPLSLEKKGWICYFLELQNRIKEEQAAGLFGAELYTRAVIRLLGTGVVYRDRLERGSYLVYTGKPKDGQSEQLLYLAETLFLPLNGRVRVLWKKHFGVLGEPQTLRLGSIQMI